MESDHPDDPAVVLRDTRKRFIAGFPQQCAELTVLVTAESAGQREAAVQLLHRMTGLSGTVGLMRVSAQAGRIEEQLRGAPVTGPVDVADGISALHQAFDADAAESPTVPEPPVSPVSQTSTPSEGALILVADDDPDVVRLVYSQLAAAGYRCARAFDGVQAIREVLTRRPAVLVLDLMMPGMTGFDILARIRPLGDRRPKVLVLSGRGREDDVHRALELGADDYLTKPFAPADVVARVGRLLQSP